MTPAPPFGRVLRLGTVAAEVRGVKRGLQRELGINDPAMGTVVFGVTAVADLRSFQRRHSLTVDGVYGPRSHARLAYYFDDYAYWLYTGKPPPSTRTVQLPFPFEPTHDTAGLPGYPATDVFELAGTRVLAPLGGVLRDTHLIPWDRRRRVGGWTTYLEAPEGTFFLTHFGDVLPSGTRITRGQDMGSVGMVPNSWWVAHIHAGFKIAV